MKIKSKHSVSSKRIMEEMNTNNTIQSNWVFSQKKKLSLLEGLDFIKKGEEYFFTKEASLKIIKNKTNRGKKFSINNGEAFGQLIVIQEISTVKYSRKFECNCRCGKTCVVTMSYLIRGKDQNCGCIYNKGRKTTHGKSKTSLYWLWNGIRQRCNNPNHVAFKYYGGRGISVCEEWNDFDNFYKWCIESKYKKGLSIERINVNGNYNSDNCKWIPSSRQSANTRRCRMITYKGETKCVADWARKYHLTYSTVLCRLNKKWDIDKVFSYKHQKSENTNTRVRIIR